MNKKLWVVICVLMITSLLLPWPISLADVYVAPSDTLVGTTDREKYGPYSTIQISIKNIEEYDYNGILEINLIQEKKKNVVETHTVQVTIPKGKMETVIWEIKEAPRFVPDYSNYFKDPFEKRIFQFTFYDSNTREYLGNSNSFIITQI